MDITAIIVAVVAALGSSGVGLEVLRRVFLKKDKERKEQAEVQIAKLQDSAAQREELWNEIESLRQSIQQLHEELDRWKEKYFNEVRDKAKLAAKYEVLQAQFETMNRDYMELRSVTDTLRNDMAAIKSGEVSPDEIESV